jgi:hypothetical protein
MINGVDKPIYGIFYLYSDRVVLESYESRISTSCWTGSDMFGLDRALAEMIKLEDS